MENRIKNYAIVICNQLQIKQPTVDHRLFSSKNSGVLLLSIFFFFAPTQFQLYFFFFFHTDQELSIMGKTHDISENTGSCLSAVTYPPWIVLLWTREGVGGKG